MLRMAQVQYIKDLYENEEKSLREISRITGHSFETVQKYAQKENWNEDNLPDTEPTSYPVLIFVFHMGMQGAAIATVIGQVASFVVSVVYLPRFKTIRLSASAFRLNIRTCGRYCDIRFEQLYYPVCHHNRHGANQ